MEKRQLGQTGIEMSVLGLGTVKFGRNEGVKYPESFDIPDDAALADLLSIAKDLGINTLDTAPAYGTSEERLGGLLKGQRIEKGLDITVNGTVPGEGTYSVTLMGQKPTK